MLPRDLHPVAWWIWALGLAAAASRTTNPWLLVLIVLVACLAVVTRRTDAPWALSFRYYLYLGAFVIVLRLVFRVIFGSGFGGEVLLDLPEIPLPDWAAGITLFGPVLSESLLAGLYDGMRLASILIVIGAANTLANPKRLLAALPGAFYEIGTAVVVALAVFPQLAESLQRVRRARNLRGRPEGRVAGFRRIVVPVLEDALERSIALAASMDARGYGRSGGASRTETRLVGALMIGALIGLCIGAYAVLDASAPRLLATPMILVGVALAVGGFAVAGRRVKRTRYRPDPWRIPETLTALSGVVVAVLVFTVASSSPLTVMPDLDALPPITLPLLIAGVLGVLPAFVTPPPALSADLAPDRSPELSLEAS